jgi:hypothetical protein
MPSTGTKEPNNRAESVFDPGSNFSQTHGDNNWYLEVETGGTARGTTSLGTAIPSEGGPVNGLTLPRSVGQWEARGNGGSGWQSVANVGMSIGVSDVLIENYAASNEKITLGQHEGGRLYSI